MLPGRAYVREVRSGAAGMASQRGGLCVGVQASESVDRALGTLSDLIWQVEPTLGTLRKDGWASGRGGYLRWGLSRYCSPRGRSLGKRPHEGRFETACSGKGSFLSLPVISVQPSAPRQQKSLIARLINRNIGACSGAGSPLTAYKPLM